MNALLMRFFQHPAFLWIIIAVMIPIIIEWLLRRRRRRIRWAAMRYLLDTERPKKIRMQDRILLILRMIIIGLIVLAIARPLIRPEDIITIDRQDRSVVMFFDGTYSNAQRVGNMSSFQTAQRMANDVVIGLPDGVELCIGQLGQSMKEMQDWTNDKALMRESIDGLKVSHGSGPVRDGLEWVLKKVKEKTVGSQMACEIFIFSDMQAQTWTKGDEAGQGGASGIVPQLTELAQVYVCSTGGGEGMNMFVTRFEPVDKVLAVGVTTEFEVEVQTTGVRKSKTLDARLTLYVNDEKRHFEEIEVLGEGSVLRVPYKVLSAGEQVVRVIVECDDDNSPLDNERLYLAEVPQAMRVLVIDDGADEAPHQRRSVFWEYAIAPPSAPGREPVSAFTVTPYTWDDAQKENFGDYGAVILANVREPSAGLISRLIFYVREGGCLVTFIGEGIEPYPYSGLNREGKGPLVEFRDPKDISAFMRPLIPDAGNLEAGTLKKIRELGGAGGEGELKTLAQTSDGTPIVMVRQFGQGTSLIMAIDPSLDWSVLPLVVDFPVFVQELLRAILGDPNRFVNLKVGEEFSEPVLISTQHLLLKTPDGRKARLTPETLEGADLPRVTYADTDVQGLYQMEAPAGVLARKRFIVNLNPEESDMAMWDEGDFRSAVSGNCRFLFPNDPIIKIIEKEHTLREFAGMILFLVFLLLLAESFLAMRFGMRKG